MKIKDQYKGKTILVYDSILGERKIVVDEIKTQRYAYYITIGLGYLFEKENTTISYTGIDQETAQSDAVEEPKAVEPTETRKKPATKTRKRKRNASAN